MRSLVESWRSSKTVGRIIYLHHSPYTTETSRWQQSETLWVRKHLRAVLDRVAAELAGAWCFSWGATKADCGFGFGGACALF